MGRGSQATATAAYGGRTQATTRRPRPNAVADDRDWSALVNEDPEQFAVEVARAYPRELWSALQAATPLLVGEKTPWWETYDKVELGRPFQASWGPILIPVGSWDHFGDLELHYDGANDYELEVEQLLDFVTAVEADDEFSFPELSPFPDFDEFEAL